MYITCLAASPCTKIEAFLGNSTTFLATPADSRKLLASKECCLTFSYLRGSAGFAMVRETYFTTEPRVGKQNTNVCANGQISSTPSSSILFVEAKRPKRETKPRASA